MAEETQNVEKDLVKNVQEMERFLKNEIDGLRVVDQELEQEMEKVDRAIEEGKKLIELGEEEIRELKKVLKDLRSIENDIKKSEKLASSDENSDRSEFKYFEKLEHDELKQIQDALNQVKNLESQLQSEEELANDEISTFIEAVEELKMAVKASSQVKHSLEVAQNTESALEQIASQNNWNNLMNALRTEKQEVQSAQNLFSTMQEEERRIEQKLEQLKQEIDKEVEMEVEEIKEIKQDIQELSKIMNEMKSQIEPIAEKEVQKLDKVGGGEAEYGGKRKEIANDILSSLNEIEKEEMQLEKHLEKILQLKQSEVSLERKVDEAETKNLEAIRNYVSK